MAHLSNFGVGNFRSFKDIYNFEFRPITILTGKNSSGKSSLAKAMLLFKSSGIIAGDNPYFDDIEVKPDLNLGNFENLINKMTNSQEVVIELPCRFTTRTSSTIRLTYLPGKKQIKGGHLCKVLIYNNDDNSTIFSFDSDSQNVGIKINYTEMFNMAMYDSSKDSRYRELKKEIKEKQSNYKIENIDNNNLENYPPDLAKLIKEVEDSALVEVTRNPGGGRMSFKDCYMYYKSCLVMHSPILDFYFKYNSESPLLKMIHEELESSAFPNYSDFIKHIQITKEKFIELAEHKGQDLIDFILDEELRLLDSLLVGTDNKDPFAPLEPNSFNESYMLLREFLDAKNYLNGGFSMLEDIKIREGEVGLYTEIGSGISFEPLFEILRHSPLFKSFMNDDTAYEKSECLLLNRVEINQLIKRCKEKGIVDFNSNSNLFLVDYVHGGLRNAFKCIESIFRKIEYIPSVRTEVNRRYKIGENSSEFNKILHSFFKKSQPGTKSHPFIDKYVREFGIADKIEFVIADDNYDSRIKIWKDGKEYDLADIGYGLSQVMPIILKLALIIIDDQYSVAYGENPCRILIVEEPETNLHPALQSKLADLFIECYDKYNIQLIIETHSEYLIRKLQYLIADKRNKKNKFKAEDAVIYYFNDPEKLEQGEPYIKKINFNIDGTLTDDFGSGFFDEADNLAIRLFNLNNAQKN